ncbi:MAG: SGNH/GDSL hydrolase family protein [Capsulimonadaceae bacterium]|nr:SGNH/GDSL hydrolase family protein [Capsulimonadaceae bacterium]
MHSLQLLTIGLAAVPLFATLAASADVPAAAPVPAVLCQPRLGLGNFFAKVKKGEPVTVAYFGGSITAANGWRPKTMAWFRQKYPDVKFTEVAAAIGGTGSYLGAYRFHNDVLVHNPDLIFVEFAVNDGGDKPEAIWRQMEGIVRQARRANPKVDICYIYTFRVGYEAQLSQGVNPPAASADEKLADYYGIPSINVALETVHRQQAGKIVYIAQKDATGHALPVADGVTLWSNDGVHPLDAGHEIYTQVIADAFEKMESIPPVGAYPTKAPFVADNWENAKQAPILPSMLSAGWTKLSAVDGIGKQFHSLMPEIWQATQPGETLTFKFKGTAVNLYDILGPDGGEAIVTLDGKEVGTTPLFDHYCTYHRLNTLAIGSGLADAVHTVKVELSSHQPDRTPASKQETGAFDPKKYEGVALRFGSIMLIGDVVN